MSATFQLPPAQVAECWDAVSMTHNLKTLDGHAWTTLRSALMKLTDDGVAPPSVSSSGVVQIRRKVVVSSPPSSSSTKQAVVTPSGGVKTETNVGSTSSSTSVRDNSGGQRRISLGPRPPPSSLSLESVRKKAKYEERQGVGTVVASYAPETTTSATTTTTPSSAPRCVVEWRSDAANVTRPYRHLFTTPPETARALEGRLRRLTTLFRENHGFGTGDLADWEAVGVPRQDAVCCTGRVCSSVRICACVFLCVYLVLAMRRFHRGW